MRKPWRTFWTIGLMLVFVAMVFPAHGSGHAFRAGAMIGKSATENQAGPADKPQLPIGDRRKKQLRDAKLFETITVAAIGGGGAVLGFIAGSLPLAIAAGASAVFIVLALP